MNEESRMFGKASEWCGVCGKARFIIHPCIYAIYPANEKVSFLKVLI
jgi:hypothetical protein